MPVTSFKVVLDQPDRSFYSGDFLRGKVIIDTSEDEKIHQGITLKFEGTAEVEWAEKTYCDDQVKYFKQKKRYFKTVYKYGTDHATILTSVATSDEDITYEMPFEYCLPEGLPSSLTSKYGIIWYKVEATYRRSSTERYRACLPFLVNGVLNLNENPELKIPTKRAERMNIFSLLYCSLSPVYVTLNVEKTGFSLGENIKYSTAIHNRTRQTLEKIQMSLIQDITCKTEQDSIYLKNCHQKIVLKMTRPEVLKGQNVVWEDRLTVPPLPPTREDPEEIVELSMEICSFRVQKLNICIPIIIGTIPLRTTHVVHIETHTHGIKTFVDDDTDSIQSLEKMSKSPERRRGHRVGNLGGTDALIARESFQDTSGGIATNLDEQENGD